MDLYCSLLDISSQAALVYVITAICLPFINNFSPCSLSKKFNVFIRLLVFPEPAPANTKKLFGELAEKQLSISLST